VLRRLAGPAALLLAAAASMLLLLRQQGLHPLADRARPPACGALAAAGTGGFTLVAPIAGPLDDFDPRAVRCAVALGGSARADVAVLTTAALRTTGADTDTQALLQAWIEGEGLAGTRLEAVAGPWRSAYAEAENRTWRRILVDDNGVLVAIAPQGLNGDASLQVARDLVESLRAAPPAY
jgi:hypothetical protein